MDWGLPAVLRIVGVSGVVVWSGFSIWRQTRFEFDQVAGVYLGAGVLASLILGLGNWYYALVFASGWVIAGWTARNYRKIRWYKSGKPGMVGLVSLMWSAAGIIGVALLNPGDIDWVGLFPEQWLSAWLLVAAGG